MNNEGPEKIVVPGEATKKLNIALRKQAQVQTTLFDNTIRSYIWKWLPESRGKSGNTLLAFVKSRHSAFSVVDTSHDPLTNTTTVLSAFVRYPPSGNIPLDQRMAKLTFKVLNPGGLKSENIVLEFGHEEIPFDKEKYGTTRS